MTYRNPFRTDASHRPEFPVRPKLVLLRALARVRRLARGFLGGALYGMGIAWWVGYGTFYTVFGWAFVGLTMLVTTGIAVACAIVGGEKFKPGG